MSDKPLDLTVHSLPAPGNGAEQDPTRTHRGRWQMMGVLLLCAAPVIASYFTYYVIRPEGRRNFGDLIDPQRPLPEMGSLALDGKPLTLRALKGQWLLISVATGDCNVACLNHLYLQRQLRESLGKDKDRLDWVWLVTDAQPIVTALQPALAQATVVRVDAAALATWLAPATGKTLPDHLYVVDPLGNWMMRLPATPVGDSVGFAAKAKADLQRLMRASAFWDTAGR